MPLKPDMKYNGTIAAGSCLYETQTGTLGYQVQIDCPEGNTNFVIWLTEKNKIRAEKYFEILGVEKSQLKSQTYIDMQLGLDIEGREISFGTREEEYNSKKSIKVAWIGKRSDANLARGAASFFGGKQEHESKQDQSYFGDPGITDNDIPF